FSTSTPMETEATFLRLRHLRRIEIILPPNTSLADKEGESGKSSPSLLSLTRQVIKSLRGLREFTISDTTNRTIHGPAFFTTGFLQALDSAHRISLRTLNIWLDFKPESGDEKALYSLLISSSIKDLNLLWPDLDGQVLEHLPKSIINLRLPLPEGQSLEHFF